MLKNKEINIDKILFLFAFFLIEFSTFATNVIYVRQYAKLITDISLAIFLLDAILVGYNLKFNYKKIIIIFMFIAFSFFIYINTDDSLILQLCLTLVCSLNKDFKQCVKSDLFFKIIIFMVIYLAYLTGNTKNDYFIRYGEIRNALGFNHPNTFGFFILMFYFEFIYVFKEKMNVFIVTFLGACSLLLIGLANSRSSQISIIAFLIMYVFLYIIKKIRKRENTGNIYLNILGGSTFIIFTLISFVITNFYTEGVSWVTSLNRLLSNRIYIQAQFLKVYDISLVGKNIEFFNTLDNAYLRCILNLGIIGMVIYSYIYNRIFYYVKRNKDNILGLIVFVLMIYGLMEWYIIRPILNIFLIYISTYFLKKKEELNEQ